MGPILALPYRRPLLINDTRCRLRRMPLLATDMLVDDTPTLGQGRCGCKSRHRPSLRIFPDSAEGTGSHRWTRWPARPTLGERRPSRLVRLAATLQRRHPIRAAQLGAADNGLFCKTIRRRSVRCFHLRSGSRRVAARADTTYNYVGSPWGGRNPEKLGTNMTGFVTFNFDTTGFSGTFGNHFNNNTASVIALQITAGPFTATLPGGGIYDWFITLTDGEITAWLIKALGGLPAGSGFNGSSPFNYSDFTSSQSVFANGYDVFDRFTRRCRATRRT
jgi:hypothetical protein